MERLRVGYARVSSKQQADTDALKQQIDRLERCGVSKVYVDVESGRKESRKGINQLFADIKAGEVREIVATRVDRLGRNVIAIHRAIELFKQHGVKVTILDSPIDGGDGAFSWLQLNHIAGMAEFESRLLSERSRHGMNFYRQNLRYYKPPMGYKKDSEGRLIVDEEKRELVREIIDRLQTYSYNSISKWMYEEHGVKFYSSSFYKWIINPCLRGHTFYKLPDGTEEKHYHTHEAILTEEEYETITNHSRMKYRKDSHTNKKVHFLSGMMRCGLCGGSLTKQGNYKAGDAKWQCTNYRKFGRSACNNSKTIAVTVASRLVIAQLAKYGDELGAIVQQEIAHLRNKTESHEYSRIKEELRQLESLQIKNPHIDAAIADLETQLKMLEIGNEAIENNLGELADICLALTQADFLEGLSQEELRGICGKLLVRVEYFGGARDLRCRFKDSLFSSQ